MSKNSFPHTVTEKIKSNIFSFSKCQKDKVTGNSWYTATHNGCEIKVLHRPSATYPYRVICKTNGETRQYIGTQAKIAFEHLKG